MVKIEDHTSQSDTAATGEDKNERPAVEEKAVMAAEIEAEPSPSQSRTSDSRRCVVCSAEVLQDAKLFSCLSEFERMACSLISKTPTARLSEKEGGVVCRQCMDRVAAVLGRAEISLPQAAPRNVSSASTEATSANTTSTKSADTPMANTSNTSTPPNGSNKDGFPRAAKYAIPVVVGGVTAAVAAPLVVAAAGFGAGGIAAGSLAASMMSSAWTTGIGVGVVSTLQSIGAAGMGAAGFAATAGAGASVGAGVGGLWDKFTGRREKKGDDESGGGDKSGGVDNERSKLDESKL